ncbi:DUF7947 five-stranded beta-barrel domain-containing protein [Bordetella bronchiseptica]
MPIRFPLGFTAVVAVVLNRRKSEEMKLLNEALQKSLAQNEAMQLRLLQTVDKMVEALQPAVKQAHVPIGRSVQTISVYQQGTPAPATVLDRASKELANAPKDTSITETRPYVGVISELDMLSGNCKVSLDGFPPDERINAVITDPVVQRADNAYVVAMARISPVAFLAKAEIDAEGEIVRLHITDLSA